MLTLADNETLLNNNGEVIKVLTDEVAVQKKKDTKVKGGHQLLVPRFSSALGLVLT